jgi:hypothetical protein
MSDPNLDLSELCEGYLTPELLDDLVTDLTQLTSIEAVMVRGGEFTMAEQTQMDLPTAVEHMKANKLRGIQIRYTWDGVAWLDTLLKSAQGVKLVRMPDRVG